MRNVLLITFVHFWRLGAGHKTKISHLVTFLAKHVNLTVAFVLPLYPQEDDILEIEKNYSIRILLLSKNEGEPFLELGKRLAQFASVNTLHCCIIEFIQLTFFLKYLPSDIIKILDTHDIESEKVTSYKQFNHHVSGMSIEAEIDMYNLYDYIMSICVPDYNQLIKLVSEYKIINVPHAPSICNTPVKKSVKTIGFVGNAFFPNIDGIKHFMEECWNNILLKFPDLNLNIYGYIGDTLNNWEIFKYKNVHVKGYVADINMIYEEIDIAINPVRFGAGIKIKSLEAMAYGKPLIATPHSARGLETGRNKSYIMACNRSEFINAIEHLVTNFTYRKQLSQNAQLFINENFNEKK